MSQNRPTAHVCISRRIEWLVRALLAAGGVVGFLLFLHSRPGQTPSGTLIPGGMVPPDQVRFDPLIFMHRGTPLRTLQSRVEVKDPSFSRSVVRILPQARARYGGGKWTSDTRLKMTLSWNSGKREVLRLAISPEKGCACIESMVDPDTWRDHSQVGSKGRFFNSELAELAVAAVEASGGVWVRSNHNFWDVSGGEPRYVGGVKGHMASPRM